MNELLLDRLLDRPIAFHRVFVDVTGSVLSALMLSQAMYWSRRTTNEDGWFYKGREEWEEETGMGRYEQETARKRLRATDFWEEELRGAPARLYYRVNRAVLYRVLVNWVEESNQPVGGNPTNTTETTTETTTKITTNNNSSGSGSVFVYYKQNFPGMMTEAISDQLGDFIDNYGVEATMAALETAVMAEKRSLRYVNGILRNSGGEKGVTGGRKNEWDDPKFVEQQQQQARARNKRHDYGDEIPI